MQVHMYPPNTSVGCEECWFWVGSQKYYRRSKESDMGRSLEANSLRWFFLFLGSLSSSFSSPLAPDAAI